MKALTDYVAAFHSEWSDPIGGVLPPDLEKHEKFKEYGLLVMAQEMPSLIAFLHGCRARVLVGPGIFSFDLPEQRGSWIDLPMIAERLLLLPWSDESEVAH